jgi:hypothetical protein
MQHAFLPTAHAPCRSSNNKKNRKERKEEIKARQKGSGRWDGIYELQAASRLCDSPLPSHLCGPCREAKGQQKREQGSSGDKEKDPLVLNYSYFVPDRTDRLGAPAQRMTLPPKEPQQK